MEISTRKEIILKDSKGVLLNEVFWFVVLTVFFILLHYSIITYLSIKGELVLVPKTFPQFMIVLKYFLLRFLAPLFYPLIVYTYVSLIEEKVPLYSIVLFFLITFGVCTEVLLGLLRVTIFFRIIVLYFIVLLALASFTIKDYRRSTLVFISVVVSTFLVVFL